MFVSIKLHPGPNVCFVYYAATDSFHIILFRVLKMSPFNNLLTPYTPAQSGLGTITGVKLFVEIFVYDFKDLKT